MLGHLTLPVIDLPWLRCVAQELINTRESRFGIMYDSMF